MNNFLNKLYLNFENFLKERNISAVVSIVYVFYSILFESNELKFKRLSGLLAHYPSLINIKFFVERLKKLVDYDEELRDVVLRNSIIIKDYVSENEKGLILISFERELDKLCNRSVLRAIEEKYHILFMPSWTGFFSPELVKFSFIANQEYFVMPVHERERKYGEYLGPFCVSLPFNAASWVNADLFNKKYDKRDIDCIVVANFSRFKRHWLLFKILSRLKSDLKVVCVGVPWGGRTRDSIKNEAELFGVSKNVEVIESPPQDELREYYQRSKVFCALSFREGSFISVAEALMSGTPVIMFENSHIGTKSLINKENGALVSSVREYADKIEELINRADNDNIRISSRKNFSSRCNCEKLNIYLKDFLGESLGGKWTKDISYFYSMRLSFYYDDACSPDFDKKLVNFNGFNLILS